MRDYLLFFLGRSYHRVQRCDEAREVFRELSEGYPESRWSSIARDQVASLGPCPPLEGAREPPIHCEDLTQVVDRADCFFRVRSYSKARELYRDLVEGGGIFFLVRLSQAAARSQDFKTAIWANEQLRLRYPRAPVAEEALRKIAFLYQDSGDFRSAIPVLSDLVQRSRNPQERRHLWERIGWSHFRLEEYPGAVEALESALTISETPFSLYWKGRSLERMGKKGEGRGLFQRIALTYRGNYYGFLALERLPESPPKTILGEWWPQRPGDIRWLRQKEVFESSTDLQRIYELASLGLFADAEVEIRRARARLGWGLPSDPKKIKRVRDGFSFETRLPKDEDPDYRIPYTDSLFGEIKRQKDKIDPFLVYAMMRQESRFRESAISSVGAVGLMQIMPGTGRRLAEEAGWDGYETGWLTHPITNIELGVRYIRKLQDLFAGKWYAVAASYNAGEQVVGEWLKQRRGVPEEEFIEEIPYQETRDYVKKVYANWQAYRYLYDAD